MQAGGYALRSEANADMARNQPFQEEMVKVCADSIKAPKAYQPEGKFHKRHNFSSAFSIEEPGHTDLLSGMRRFDTVRSRFFEDNVA